MSYTPFANGEALSAVRDTINDAFVELYGRTTVSVKEFGAIGDGVTDDTAAIQAGLNYLNSVGGGTLFLPAGRYRKLDVPGTTLFMYSNTRILGEGDASVIVHDDRDTVARGGNDMLTCSNTSNVTFENFKIEGTLGVYLNDTNKKQCLTGTNITGLRMSNVTITEVRYMATAFTNVNDGQVIGCRFHDVLRDGVRFTQSKDIRVIGNHFLRVADDAVALHSVDPSTAPVSRGMVVSDNTFDTCQGIKVLGGKLVTITGNKMQRTIRTPILFSNATGFTPEGQTPMFALNISNNVILDSFGNYGTDYNIYVEIADRVLGGASTQPGALSSTFPYNYLNDTDVAGTVRVGGYAIQICNNTIGYTLARGVNFSSYGVGEILDRTTVSYIDPAITDDDFCAYGIRVFGPVRGLLIDSNILFGGGRFTASPASRPAISLGANDTSANEIAITDAVVSRNIITDWINDVGVSLSHPNANVSRHVTIVDNFLNLDPFFRHPGHNATTNRWSADGDLQAINYNSIIYGGTCSRNHFKNCSRLYDSGNQTMYFENNAYFEPASGTSGLDGQANNRGIRRVPSSPRVNCFVIDGNPASATFDQIVTIPNKMASSIPTTGTYVIGHVVENAVPAILGVAPNRYMVSGWQRAVTGSAHVLNTDWVEMRTLTGT